MTGEMYRMLLQKEQRPLVETKVQAVGDIAELGKLANGLDLIVALTDVVNMREVTNAGLIAIVRLGFGEAENITYDRMSIGESKVEVKGRLWKAELDEFSLSFYVANDGFASNPSYMEIEPKNGVGKQIIFIKENEVGGDPSLSIWANDDFGKDFLYIGCDFGDTPNKLIIDTNGKTFFSVLNNYR